MANRIIFIQDTSFGKKDGTRDFYAAFVNALKERGASDGIQVIRTADIGYYGRGMVVRILPENIAYQNVKDTDIIHIIDQTVKAGKIIDELKAPPPQGELKIVLRNCGRINPESLEDYLAAGGYQGLRKGILGMTPEQLIAEVKKSGLRGRGGGGFLTGLKWDLTRKSQDKIKFIICNGDEGDPGAYMDRSVLEGDPHSVVEGMILAGFAIGASQGYFYIRAEYPLAVERVRKAISQCYDAGLLGENILGSGFSFDLDVRLGAGAFVCGEETALIASMEGKRGYPRPRPPFPAVSGMWGKPTAINNVETLANVPVILTKGADWFSSIGTKESKGTKVFALTGKVKNSGLIEVPMGITIHDIVYNIGGGTVSGLDVKAVQTGGPSGGVIPKDLFDTPVSYENLMKLGSIMGSGGMIVMDSDDCMIDIAKFYLNFCVDESCGKCAPCRIGGYQMLKILNRISGGRGQKEDIAKLHDIADAMRRASLCGLGQSASNPVVSTLKYFGEEYTEHIERKHCKTGKCKDLVQYSIVSDACKRCRRCVTACPAGAIEGDKDKGYTINPDKCVKCGQCYEVCNFKAIKKD